MSSPYLYNKRVRNAPIRRRLDRRFLSWVMVSACVGTVVAFGFVYSARCHFEAVALGYETQQYRKDLEQQAEKRRQLELERARSLAPEELEHRARRLGLREPERPTPGETENETKNETKNDKLEKNVAKVGEPAARRKRTVAP